LVLCPDTHFTVPINHPCDFVAQAAATFLKELFQAPQKALFTSVPLDEFCHLSLQSLYVRVIAQDLYKPFAFTRVNIFEAVMELTLRIKIQRFC
jgi:hypothetical protein